MTVVTKSFRAFVGYNDVTPSIAAPCASSRHCAQFFGFFVVTFVVLCIVVFAKGCELYRDTVDLRLKPLFWTGACVRVCV